jgi:hypothetical protein
MQWTGVDGDPFLVDRHGALVLLQVAERVAALVRDEVEQIGRRVGDLDKGLGRRFQDKVVWVGRSGGVLSDSHRGDCGDISG